MAVNKTYWDTKSRGINLWVEGSRVYPLLRWAFVIAPVSPRTSPSKTNAARHHATLCFSRWLDNQHRSRKIGYTEYKDHLDGRSYIHLTLTRPYLNFSPHRLIFEQWTKGWGINSDHRSLPLWSSISMILSRNQKISLRFWDSASGTAMTITYTKGSISLRTMIHSGPT